MSEKERKEMKALTKDVVKKIDVLYTTYRMKVAEIIKKEEEKLERIEEHFSSSSRLDAIEEEIEKLEDTLDTFEAAVDMIKEVEYA